MRHTPSLTSSLLFSIASTDNFRKNMAIATSIRRILDFQIRNRQSALDYAESNPTFHFLSEFGSMIDEEALYNLSLQREARQRDPNTRRSTMANDHSPNPPVQLPAQPSSGATGLAAQFSFL